MIERTRSRWARHMLSEVLLTVTAALGACCLLTALAATVLGLRFLVFQSGSMQPTIGTGALGVADRVEASKLRVGDVVGVRTPAGSHVTHRVVEVTQGARSATLLRMKGDANEVADPEPYSVTEADRVLFAIPGAGYVVSWLTSPAGTAALGLYAGWVTFMLLRGRTKGRPRRPGRHTSASGRRGRRQVQAIAAAVSTGVVFWAGPATAVPWGDAVTVHGTSLDAATVQAPTLSCGTLGVLSVSFHWTAVADATGYQLTAGGETFPAHVRSSGG